MEEIHGRLVIDFIFTLPNSSTRDSVVSSIKEKFGNEQKFHSCKADGFTADGILTFFENKGKIAFNENGYKSLEKVRCNH